MEEILPGLVSGVGAWMLMALSWAVSRVRRPRSPRHDRPQDADGPLVLRPPRERVGVGLAPWPASTPASCGGRLGSRVLRVCVDPTTRTRLHETSPSTRTRRLRRRLLLMLLCHLMYSTHRDPWPGFAADSRSRPAPEAGKEPARRRRRVLAVPRPQRLRKVGFLDQAYVDFASQYDGNPPERGDDARDHEHDPRHGQDDPQVERIPHHAKQPVAHELVAAETSIPARQLSPI